MKRPPQNELKARMFKEIKRRSLNLSQGEIVKTGFLPGCEGLPLVIEPAVEGVEIADWARTNLEFIERSLLKYGGVLFRGFDVNTVQDFHNFSQATFPSLELYVIKYSDREPGPEKIRPAVTISADRKHRWHNDDYFSRDRWPMKIFFYCFNPAEKGGQTPIADGRKIIQLMNPKIRERFVSNGILYVRNYWPELGTPWQNEFLTSDIKRMEAYCRKSQMEFEWMGGNRLRTRCRRPAVLKHPLTGEPVWFNQALSCHISCLDPIIVQAWSNAFREEDYPSHCYFGDGSPIDGSVMSEIYEAYDKAGVSFQWQKGDMLLIQNMLVSHSRTPFTGKREHYKTQGEYVTYKDVEHLLTG